MIEMSPKPVNPVGACFDSAAHQICFAPDTPPDARLCHGLGISNVPGEVGHVMGHAWVEFTTTEGIRAAYDTTYGVKVEAEGYRSGFKLNYCIEYTKEEALEMWLKTNYPGPWDKKILAVTDKVRGD